MAKLIPDLDMAAAFLDHLDPKGFFTFQTFADCKVDAAITATRGGRTQNLARVLHGTLDQHAEHLVQLNEQGAGVFVTVNETDGRGRKAENITRVRALFVDLDGAPVEPVRRHVISPHILVESSPVRFHAYWLTYDCPLEQFKATQQRLALHFEGDNKVCDLPRVMRLPGFFHQKHAPFMTHTIHSGEQS